MEAQTSLYNALEIDIKPKEFEQFCCEALKEIAKDENLSDIVIEPDIRKTAYDGIYQIDVSVEFTILRSKIKMLVECKKIGRPVERDEAILLWGKLLSLGANKGILISTSGFQSGAIDFAKEHGISLWKIYDNVINHVVAGGSQDLQQSKKLQLAAESYLPKYFVAEIDSESSYPVKRIYPTEKMCKSAMKEAQEKSNLEKW